MNDTRKRPFSFTDLFETTEASELQPIANSNTTRAISDNKNTSNTSPSKYLASTSIDQVITDSNEDSPEFFLAPNARPKRKSKSASSRIQHTFSQQKHQLANLIIEYKAKFPTRVEADRAKQTKLQERSKAPASKVPRKTVKRARTRVAEVFDRQKRALAELILQYKINFGVGMTASNEV